MKHVSLFSGSTAGGTSQEFVVLHNQPVALAARGLAGTETGDLQILVGGVATDVYYQGEQVQLTATNNVLAIDIPGSYVVVLSATAGATSVDVIRSGV